MSYDPNVKASHREDDMNSVSRRLTFLSTMTALTNTGEAWVAIPMLTGSGSIELSPDQPRPTDIAIGTEMDARDPS